ncbi:MAG: hypothetical protein K6G22_08140 [Lachnospiraceae bacterium]|nr:hypothetical protein [Lachnospiraceae bacterium]
MTIAVQVENAPESTRKTAHTISRLSTPAVFEGYTNNVLIAEGISFFIPMISIENLKTRSETAVSIHAEMIFSRPEPDRDNAWISIIRKITVIPVRLRMDTGSEKEKLFLNRPDPQHISIRRSDPNAIDSL